MEYEKRTVIDTVWRHVEIAINTKFSQICLRQLVVHYRIHGMGASRLHHIRYMAYLKRCDGE